MQKKLKDDVKQIRDNIDSLRIKLQCVQVRVMIWSKECRNADQIYPCHTEYILKIDNRGFP